ncbi:MAG: hypothetical protein GY929_20255 [Actinomycetia bacterium]|nr:hypothetical protein [Actinomycetes bacterium]
MTRLLLGLALVVGFLGVPLAAPAAACSCVPIAESAVTDAGVAVVATVTDRQGDWYTLEVTNDLLGNVDDVIDVESPGRDEAGCGITWEVGDEVATLVHVVDGHGTVNLCSIADDATLMAAVHRPEGPVGLLTLDSAPATVTVGRLLVQFAVVGGGLFIGWYFLRRRSARPEE